MRDKKEKQCLNCKCAFEYEDTKRNLNRRFCSGKCARSHNGKNNKGNTHSLETKKRMSENNQGASNPFFGKKHSQETNDKISKANKWGTEKYKYCNLQVIEKEVLDGLLLGDGCLSERSRISARLTFGFKFKETVEDIYENLPSLKFSPSWQSNTTNCWHSKSIMYHDLLFENNRWYVNGKKIVPSDVLITPISCYWWFIGDGYIIEKNVYLCTDCFTNEEVDFLVSKLNDLEFVCKKTSTNRIRFFKKDSINFLNWLKAHNKIHTQYQYKWEI